MKKLSATILAAFLLTSCEKEDLLPLMKAAKKKDKPILEASVQIELMTAKSGSLEPDSMQLTDKAIRFDFSTKYSTDFIPKEDTLDQGQQDDDIYILHNNVQRVDAIPFGHDSIAVIINNPVGGRYWLRIFGYNINSRAYVLDNYFNPEGTDIVLKEPILVKDNTYTYWLFRADKGWPIARFSLVVR